jgi:hypothetical protein
MKIIKVATIVIFACGLCVACDTDRYANQSTMTVREAEDPELRKALINELNALHFDYEITKEGDIRYPQKNQMQFEAILTQVSQEQTAGK